jgi:hypothetical protein
MAFALDDGQKLRFSNQEDGQLNNYSLAGYLSYSPSNISFESIEDEYRETENFHLLIWNSTVFLKPESPDLLLKEQPDWLVLDAKNTNWRADTLYYPKEGFILDRNIPFFRKREIISGLEKHRIAFHDLKEMESIKITCNGSY